LQKGLLAGLGAYGGAGLAGGLMGAGAAGAQTAANQAIAASPEFASFNATSSLPGAFGEAAGSAVPTFSSEAARQAALTGAQSTLASPGASMLAGAQGLGTKAGLSSLASQVGGTKALATLGLAAAAPAISDALKPKLETPPVDDTKMPQRLQYNTGVATDPTTGLAYTPPPDVPGYDNLGQDFGKQQRYFPTAGYENITDKRAKELRGYATGGIMPTQGGGPVEAMSNANAIGANTGFPMADINKGTYATPWQTPVSQNVVQGVADAGVNSMTGEQNEFAAGGQAKEDIGYKGYKSPPVNTLAPDGPPAGEYPGSPTGSVGWDVVNAIANQPVSPIAAAIAQHAIDNFSTISSTSVNAVNGMDAASDAAASANPSSDANAVNGMDASSDASTAAAAAAAAASAAPGGGDGAAGDGGAAAGGGDGAAGEANGGLAPYFPRHMAGGGLSAAASHLGDYSDGGRLLRGPGDGVSDSIPAMIGNKRPARLADGEFVVPARIVSELGNGSTEAGARKLYAMLDRVQAARKKSIGKGKVAKNSRADKLLPA
jgi:hypothetical protein